MSARGGQSPLVTIRAAAPTAGALAGPLLYWLLVVSGLGALTLVRLHDPADVGPIWLGGVFGVAFGQLLAFLRVRWWLPIAIAIPTGSFLAPLLAMFLYGVLGKDVEPTLLAFFPAAIGGYLSLSERGALASFWFPAVLWMLVILDGRAGDGSATLERAPFGALPFGVALAVLFVAFLRARESRRVVLWQAFGNVRIAPPRPRTVLRASPIRAAGNAAWLILVGGGALVLTAWVAPLLWQKDQMRGAPGGAAAGGTAAGYGYRTGDALPCCPAGGRRERVREYFELHHGHAALDELASCRVCSLTGEAYAGSEPSIPERPGQWYYDGGWKMEPTPTWSSATPAPVQGWPSGGSGWSTSTSTPAPIAPVPPSPPVKPTFTAVPETPPPVKPPPVVVPPKPTPAQPPKPVVVSPKHPAPVATTRAPVVSPVATTVAPATATTPAIGGSPVPPTVEVGPVEAAPPWRWMLALSAFAILAHLLVRALRRQLTLRHLARPFWNEAFDQRISNQWERVLIGLRDAGIQPRPNEAPAAFARRVGLAGMDVCATILDRVRHGVQASASDLEQMSAAASAVYATARRKAGLAARATAWLRWPLT